MNAQFDQFLLMEYDILSSKKLGTYLHYAAYSMDLDPVIRGCYNLLFAHA